MMIGIINMNSHFNMLDICIKLNKNDDSVGYIPTLILAKVFSSRSNRYPNKGMAIMIFLFLLEHDLESLITTCKKKKVYTNGQIRSKVHLIRI
jgi:hypothetical protein